MTKWKNYTITQTQVWTLTAKSKAQAEAFVRGGQPPRKTILKVVVNKGE